MSFTNRRERLAHEARAAKAARRAELEAARAAEKLAESTPEPEAEAAPESLWADEIAPTVYHRPRRARIIEGDE